MTILPAAEYRPLLMIKKREDIKHISRYKIYVDDNLICMDVAINGIDISFLHIMNNGPLYYWHCCDEAFNDLLRLIKDRVATIFEDEMDDRDL